MILLYMSSLQTEGIMSATDLTDFNSNAMQQLTDNLQHPGGRVPGPNPGAAAVTTIPTPSFIFGAKSPKRISITCNMI